MGFKMGKMVSILDLELVGPPRVVDHFMGQAVQEVLWAILLWDDGSGDFSPWFLCEDRRREAATMGVPVSVEFKWDVFGG